MKRRHLWLTALTLSLLTAAAQHGLQEQAEKLTPGVWISGELSGTGTAFQIDLTRGSYFLLSLDSVDRNFSLVLIQPNGRPLREIRCTQDPITRISEIAPENGRYLLRLTACATDVIAPYKVRLSAPRPSVAVDRLRASAERLGEDAERLKDDYRADSTQSSIRKYEEALRLWSDIGDRPEQARTLNTLARLYRDTGSLDRGLLLAANAAQLDRISGKPLDKARTNLSLAMLDLNRGKTQSAIALASESASIAQASGSDRLEAEANYFLGNVYLESVSEFDKTLPAFERASTLWQRLGDRLGVARCLYSTAAVDLGGDNAHRGLAIAEQALPIFRDLPDRRGQVVTRILLTHFQKIMGHKQVALNAYESERLAILESGNLFDKAMLFNSLAKIHEELGDYQSALPLYELGLRSNNQLQDSVGIAYSQWAMGKTYRALDKPREASNYLAQALRNFTLLDNKPMRGVVLQQQGILLASSGDLGGAARLLEESAEFSLAGNDKSEQAATLVEIGRILEPQGNSEAALRNYRQAREIRLEIGELFEVVDTGHDIARALRNKGDLEGALLESKKAIETVETLRVNFTDSELRRAYFASVRQQYELCINLLMTQHRQSGSLASAVEAFETSERSRARTLLEGIEETQVSISESLSPAQQKLNSSLLKSLNTARLNDLRSGQSRPETRRLEAEYESLQAEFRKQNPAYAAIAPPQTLSLRAVQRDLLDDDTALVEYSLGTEKSYAWVVTRESFFSYELPGRSEVEEGVAQFRRSVTAMNEAEARRHAARLSRVLLGPLSKDLTKKRLAIVADGLLQSLPFGALPLGENDLQGQETVLISAHELVTLPSASTLALLRQEVQSRPKPDLNLAVFADPVFSLNDSRLRTRQTSAIATIAAEGLVFRGDGLDLRRLAATGKEAESILSIAPGTNLAAVGFRATKTAAMLPDLRRYRIVHFATHTILNDVYPDLSALVLSRFDEQGKPRDGLLWLRDMHSLHLSADLVVLSACETAVGKDVKGEGLISMVRGFMYSGSPRVLASLWKVEDEATAEFMAEFYRFLLVDKLSPSAALRQAQISQMKKRRTQAPYYWAGFQLQGDWNP